MDFGVSRSYNRHDSARVGWFLVLVAEGMRGNCGHVNLRNELEKKHELGSAFISFKRDFMFDSSANVAY